MGGLLASNHSKFLYLELRNEKSLRRLKIEELGGITARSDSKHHRQTLPGFLPVPLLPGRRHWHRRSRGRRRLSLGLKHRVPCELRLVKGLFFLYFLSESMDFDEFAAAAEGGSGVGGEGFCVRTFSMGISTSNDPHRSLRRKLHATGADASTGVARVEIRNEAAALREAFLSYHQTIQNLQAELKEERSAAASAAQEAMSMIVRLQHEKAKAILESRQFKRVTEEKMTHDQQEIASLEDLLFKREQAMLALSCEVQAYRHRLLSYGFSIDSDAAPPSEPQTPDSASSGDSPREHLQKLEQRIFQLEQTPSSRFGNVMEKRVMVAHSPQGRSRHLRNISCGSYRSILEFNKADEFQTSIGGAPDYDDSSDRVYTVDAVHRASNDYVSTPRELQNRRFRMGGGVKELEISKLQMRLQALEDDSESMRRTLTSMGMDKMQMVILKEVAQQMCKEESAEKRIINKPSPKGSSLSIIESVVSFFEFWRKKSPQIKYTFGIMLGTVCLLLLGKPCSVRQRRLLAITQG